MLYINYYMYLGKVKDICFFSFLFLYLLTLYISIIRDRIFTTKINNFLLNTVYIVLSAIILYKIMF